jgi:hypothetical protein
MQHLPFPDELPYDPTDLSPSLRTSLPAALHFAPQAIAHNLTSDQAFLLDSTQAAASTATEMHKYFGSKTDGGHAVCNLNEPVAYQDIPAGALKQYNRMFHRTKFLANGLVKKFSSRCYTDGSRQPEGTYYSSYAGTCDMVDKFAMLAGYHARAQELHQDLATFSFDVPAAFLQGRLTEDNSPQHCYIHFASDIRHECAGKWYRRYAGTYGSKDANALFDQAFAEAMATASFYPNPEQAKIFSRIDPNDPTLSCSVAMHVDDGLGCCTHPPFLLELRTALEARFGALEWDDIATSNTGFNFQHYTDGSFTVDQQGYEGRMLHDLGATELPPVSRASLDDFFHPPTDSTPVDKGQYMKIVGCLIYLLASWHDLRKEIVYLSTRQSKPTQSDYDKAIRVLAYINCHRHHYVRYSGSDSQVYFWADASPNAHPNGHAHAGYYITIGKQSGAIASYSGIQTDCIAQGATEAEYVVLARAVKVAIHIQRLLHSLGIPQQPVTCFDDNLPAVNLANAPAVTRKSGHIHVRYHLIRDYVRKGSIRMVHVDGIANPADLLTKPLSAPQTSRHSDVIQNVSLTPLQPLLASST